MSLGNPKDTKIYILHYDEISGDELGPQDLGLRSN